MIFRKMQRRGSCRGCEKGLQIGDDIFYTHSYVNQGTTVILCMGCVQQIVEMKQQYDVVSKEPGYKGIV